MTAAVRVGHFMRKSLTRKPIARPKVKSSSVGERLRLSHCGGNWLLSVFVLLRHFMFRDFSLLLRKVCSWNLRYSPYGCIAQWTRSPAAIHPPLETRSAECVTACKLRQHGIRLKISQADRALVHSCCFSTYLLQIVDEDVHHRLHVLFRAPDWANRADRNRPMSVQKSFNELVGTAFLAIHPHDDVANTDWSPWVLRVPRGDDAWKKLGDRKIGVPNGPDGPKAKSPRSALCPVNVDDAMGQGAAHPCCQHLRTHQSDAKGAAQRH
mmetsp:Transcript_63088/g.137096  ORF Transcript_63088/g.137096 Transcript_63088/m.137096 type:complete len:267 (+) Transcript_63088:85-885(+)